MRTIKLSALTLALSMASASAFADITENFEDGNFNGWTTSGTVEINTTKTIGTYSMRLKGGATAERSFAADGDVTVQVAATSLESADHCRVYVSTDGVNWGSPVLTVSNGQDNGTFYSSTTSTTGGTTHIRYQQVGASADYCYADGISITGAAAPTPAVAVSGSGAFGNVLVGSSSSKTITVANNGNANLTVGSITGASAPFSLANDSCSNTTVSAGNNCTFDVVFAPTSQVSSSGTLTIANNDENQTIALSGTGTDQAPPPPPSGDLHVFTGDGNVSRSALSISQLNGSSLSMMDYVHYSHGESDLNVDASKALEPTNTFQGRLVLNGGNDTTMSFNETTPGKGIASAYVDPDTLPGFDFEFVQSGSHIIPKTRGLHVTGHGDWNYILEPGRVWNENNDQGYSRVAIPFALQENQANCTHNGMITFAFKNDGTITKAAVQIGGETCLYFNYEMWGLVSAQYVAGSVSNASTIINDYKAEVLNRYPVKPMSAIETDYPGVIAANFASEQASSPTTHGVLYNGVHYAAPCSSDRGEYPFCQVMSLPAYSTTKTATANFAHALLTQQYGNAARNIMVSDYVPECQDNINGTDSIWSDVSVENALDMATGNYRLSSYNGDEGSTAVTNEFFLVFTHDEKIKHSCERYIRKASPNTHFSYHSSDTYIAGVAMDAYYSQGDLYDKVVDEVYKPLNLSPVTYTTVRTQDGTADPFWSHGVTWHADDMIKVGQLINDRGVINGQQVLDGDIMDDMLLKGGDLGLETYGSESTYINGVWTYDMGQRTGAVCPNGSWVSYMSGYGGIGIVMYPNGAVYYYVSDSDAYGFGGAEKELHKISNICGN